MRDLIASNRPSVGIPRPSGDVGVKTQPVRVLYVMGSGHSGSTMLDIVLGNHPQIESVGEFQGLSKAGWINNGQCACGQRARECDYWNRVRQVLEARTGPFDPYAYATLQDTYERYHWPFRLLAERRRPSPTFLRYSRLTADLFAAVREVSGRPVIVDSSKNPSRAFALALNPAVDLRLVTLVRDARAVAWSLKRGQVRGEALGTERNRDSRPVWRAAAFWAWCHVNVSWVAACLPPDHRTFVRYEDFVAAPGVPLMTIGSLFGLDLSEVASRVIAGEPMTVGHNIAGNRLRMQGSVRLNPDFQWRSRLSRSDQVVIWSIAGPQMFWYGYRR